MSDYFWVSDLPEGRCEYKFTWSPKQLELEEKGIEFPNPIKLELQCCRQGFEVACTGNVRTKVEAQCVRCLENFEIDVNEPLSFSVRLGLGAKSVISLWTEDIVSVERFSGKIDIKPRIRDAVLLGIPNYPVCHENCLGLCPVCGVNLNKAQCEHSKRKAKSRDPRWQKLSALLERKIEEE